MIGGAMLLWFILTAMSVAFVAIDIRSTPESVVLKWGFVLVTLYTGPFGAFFYVLGCREPLPGTHEQYVAARWRQVLGSTMHCVAGDGVGILAGAVVASYLAFSHPADIAIEYALGFAFGWGIFQALFMRDMAGGSYPLALKMTFVPEFASMNTLMAGMLPVAAIGRATFAAANSPVHPEFWFVMSIALLIGAVCAFPMNYWLVSRHLKHGMMTIRPTTTAPAPMAMPSDMPMPARGASNASTATRGEIATVTLLSIVLLAIGVWLSLYISSR
jgi:hypothetical protein